MGGAKTSCRYPGGAVAPGRGAPIPGRSQLVRAGGPVWVEDPGGSSSQAE